MTKYVRIRAKGFDKTSKKDDVITVGCSQCQAIVINGVACHEQGCPNRLNKHERD